MEQRLQRNRQQGVLMSEREEQRKGSCPHRVHPRMEEAVVKGRDVWVERDAGGSIVGVSESRQALEDTDEDYAVVLRHRKPGEQ
jgi:hypothetical protein